MSLILRGSPSGTVYRQTEEASVVSATVHAVYMKVIPSSTASAGFVIAMDGDLDGSSRGYSLTQNSPTSMTLRWLTSNGANEHTFTIESGTVYDLMSIYDRAAGIVEHYVDSATPVAEFTSVGTPIDSSKFCIRLTSSPVATEDVVVGDLAVWVNGKPDSVALAAMGDNTYLGHAFKNSGCTDRYLMTGPSLTVATIRFFNALRGNNYLLLERDSVSPDPSSGSGDWMPVPVPIRTQTSSDSPAYSVTSQMLINQAKCATVSYYAGPGDSRTLAQLTSEGYYDKIEGKYLSLPPRFEGMQSYENTVNLGIRFSNVYNPEMNNGVFVADYEGDGTLSAFNNHTPISANRYEFTDRVNLAVRSVNPATGLWNLRIYKKTLEDAINSGREFVPEAMSQWGRYNSIRTHDSQNVNSNFISGLRDVPTYGDFWQTKLPLEAVVQLALEGDTELWYNISLFLGTDVEAGTGYANAVARDWTEWGKEKLYTLNYANIEAYFNKLVAILNEKSWDINKPIKIETDNQPWRQGYQFGIARQYSAGICKKLNTDEGAGLADSYDNGSGVGFLTALLVNEFKKALVVGGRANQAMSVILSANMARSAYTTEVITAIEYFMSTRPNILTASEFTVATSSFVPENNTSSLDWTAGNNVLGTTYATKADYYTALRSILADNTGKASRLFFNRQIDLYHNLNFTVIPDIKTVMSAKGITAPLEEYEGSSNSNPENTEWRDSDLKAYYNEYIRGQAGASIQRIHIETFGINNPGGLVTNTGTVAMKSVSDQTLNKAMYDATTWATLPSSKTWQVWEDYIAPLRDPAVVWQNHLDYAASIAPLDTIGIDEDDIRDTYSVVPMSVADAVRTTGSIFNGARFDGINLEGAEFFYKPTVYDARYTPVLNNGNFTGYFNISGSASSTATMYIHDTVSYDWYELVVVTTGPTVGYAVNNVLNVELATNLYLDGIVYGISGTVITGTNLEFSNDSSTWETSVALINGVTHYRKSVTTPATADTLVTESLSISDGTSNFTNSVDIVTRVGGSTYFENESLAFNFLENTLSAVATVAAISDNAITYSLTGDDAALFSIDSSGNVTPLSAENFEAPGDLNSDGVYEFTVVATTINDTASIDLIGTITDVAEHVFTYPSIINQTSVVPASTVTVTSQLLGGIAGVPFSVVGMLSSTDGGVTYSDTTKNYVSGSTYIRLISTAASAYNTTTTATGTITWSSGTDSVVVTYDVITKSPVVQVEFGSDAYVVHLEGTTEVILDNSVTAGDGTYSYALTGGADIALFVVNTTTGAINWKLPPNFDRAPEPDNTYYVEVTVTNTDGYSSTTDVKVLTITVTSTGLTAFDMPDQDMSLTPMSDGSWSTSAGVAMSIIGTPMGVGTQSSPGYHDVIKFVKYSRARTVSVTNVANTTNGEASTAFAGKYVLAEPNSSSDMSMNVTVTDDAANSITFTYNIDVT